MPTSRVLFDVEGTIAWLTFNRPDKLNALTLPILQDLASTARTLRKGTSQIVGFISDEVTIT